MMAGSDHQERERERGFDLNVEENAQNRKVFRRKAVLTDVVCLATLVCAAVIAGPGRHARWGLYVFFAFPILLLLDLLLYFLTFRRCPSCGRAFWHSGQWAARPFVWRWMRCPDCGMMEFPKICPAVIIAVTHGDKILMSKYAGREYKKYALLAGFNETGESIEETVRREVMEEVGLKVKNLRYYKSQPWSFTDTLLMGFFCELDGEDGITLDTDELAMAEWFERDKMPVEAEDLSLTNEMMMAFKHGKV